MLVDLWNRKMAQMVDIITPLPNPLSHQEVLKLLGFLRNRGWWSNWKELEQSWRKTCNESDWEWARAHFGNSPTALIYFSANVALAQCWPTEIFFRRSYIWTSCVARRNLWMPAVINLQNTLLVKSLRFPYLDSTFRAGSVVVTVASACHLLMCMFAWRLETDHMPTWSLSVLAGESQ